MSDHIKTAAAPALPPVPEIEALCKKLLAVDSDPIGAGLARNWHRNPNGPEAATALQSQAAECARLREALAIADSWLGRWAAHVGSCLGGDVCTCGLTRIRFDVSSALSQEPTP